MKKTLLLVSALFAGITAFSQEPENTPVVTSLEEGTAVVSTPNGVAVADEEEAAVTGVVEDDATGLSTEESEEILEEVINAVSDQLDEDQEIVKVGTPEVIRETVTETTVFQVPETPQPAEEEDVVEEEEFYVGSSSLDDIINTQGRITQNVSTEKHFQSVWSRKNSFNISFNSIKLEPKENYPVVYNNGRYNNLETMKSDWGLGIQYVINYRLLKNPIANMVMINLDWTPLDLNANHFKKAGDKDLFNSSDTYANNEGKNVYYLPWNVEKFQYSYGMNIGPSITLAPFTKINGLRGLHFLKFNVYYHIGYRISLLQFLTKQKYDAVTNNTSYDNYSSAASKLCFGHGLTNAVGFNVSWKAIGVGYEMNWSSLDYKSFNSNIFGKTTYKFKAPMSRVYLNIRL